MRNAYKTITVRLNPIRLIAKRKFVLQIRFFWLKAVDSGCYSTQAFYHENT